MTTETMEPLFTQTNEQNEEAEVQIDPAAPLSSLMGDGKRYKTELDLAKAVVEKDRFIQQLKSENSQLRSSGKTAETAQEVLDRLLQQVTNAQKVPPVTTQENSEQGANTEAVLTVDKIKEILDARELRSAENQNVRLVKQELEKTHGPNWGSRLQEVAKDYGMTVSEIEELARKRPQAVIKMAAPVKMAPQSGQAPQSSVNLGITGTGPEVRNQSYYNKLQKTMKPSEFFSPKVQNQMHKDMSSLGDKFLT